MAETKVTTNEILASGCLIYKTAGQALTKLDYRTILFDAESFDTDGYHSTSVDTSKITFPAAGKYLIFACAGFVANNTGTRFARFLFNGSTPIGIVGGPTTAAGTNGVLLNFSVVVSITSAGQYVELQMYQDTSGDLNSSYGLDGCYFGCARLGN